MPKYLIEYHTTSQDHDTVVFQTVLEAPEEISAQAVGRQIGPQMGSNGEELDYSDTCDRVDGLLEHPEYRVTVPSYNSDGVPENMEVTHISSGHIQVLQYPRY